MNTRVVHFEIHADDTAKCAEFYRNIFGWEITKWENPGMDYWLVRTAPEGSTELGINGGIVKRMGAKPTEGQPVNAFPCTVNVPNVDEYIKKIVDAGGAVALPKMAIPGLAWLAYLKDLDGNIFGIYEDNKEAK